MHPHLGQVGNYAIFKNFQARKIQGLQESMSMLFGSLQVNPFAHWQIVFFIVSKKKKARDKVRIILVDLI